MRLLIPVHYFPPRYNGGAEQYTLALARGLSAAGHEVTVVSVERLDRQTGPPIEEQRDRYEGISVHRLSLRECDNRIASYSFDNPFIDAWFTDFLKRHRPDLVHFQGAYRLSASAIRAASGLRLPVVVTLHDYWFVCPRLTLLRSDGRLCQGPKEAGDCVRCCVRPDRESGGYVEDWMAADPSLLSQEMVRRRSFVSNQLRSADALVAPSRFLRDIHVGLGVPESRIRIIPLGIASLPKRRRKPVGATDPIRIAYTSHLLPHKGARVLVEALVRLQDKGTRILARIYGSPSVNPAFAQALHQRADGMDYIEFRGGFAPRQLPDILAETDVVVVPSLWYENSPLVVLQAFASGVPVVASDVGALKDLLTHGADGLLFERGSANDLERQLRRLLEEPSLLRKLASRASYERTTAAEVAELEALYRKLVTETTLRAHRGLAETRVA